MRGRKRREREGRGEMKERDGEGGGKEKRGEEGGEEREMRRWEEMFGIRQSRGK